MARRAAREKEQKQRFEERLPPAHLVPLKGVDHLLDAAAKGDVLECSRLIEREGVDVNSRDDRRFATAIMKAAANSNVIVVKFLLAHGANPYLEDDVGWDTLTYACWGAGAGGGWRGTDTVDTVSTLLNYDQERNVSRRTKSMVAHRTFAGFTPLMMYVKYMGKKKHAALSGFDRKASRARLKGARGAGDSASYDDEVLNDQLKMIDLLVGSLTPKSEAISMVMSRNQFGQSVLDVVQGTKYEKIIVERIKNACSAPWEQNDDFAGSIHWSEVPSSTGDARDHMRRGYSASDAASVFSQDSRDGDKRMQRNGHDEESESLADVDDLPSIRDGQGPDERDGLLGTKGGRHGARQADSRRMRGGKEGPAASGGERDSYYWYCYGKDNRSGPGRAQRKAKNATGEFRDDFLTKTRRAHEQSQQRDRTYC